MPIRWLFNQLPFYGFLFLIFPTMPTVASIGLYTDHRNPVFIGLSLMRTASKHSYHWMLSFTTNVCNSLQDIRQLIVKYPYHEALLPFKRMTSCILEKGSFWSKKNTHQIVFSVRQKRSRWRYITSRTMVTLSTLTNASSNYISPLTWKYSRRLIQEISINIYLYLSKQEKRILRS